MSTPANALTGPVWVDAEGNTFTSTDGGKTFTAVEAGTGGTVTTDATLQGTGAGGTPLTNAVTKRACVVATTANITLSAAQTIDGVAVVAGQRVLVTAQTDATTNGIYVCASGAWTRSTDFASAAQMIACVVMIQQGTVGTGQLWVFTTASAVTVGTTALTFSLVPGGGALAGQTLAAARRTLAPEYFVKLLAPAQSLVLTGLNGDVDGDYDFYMEIISAAGGSSFQFEPNQQTAGLVQAIADGLNGGTHAAAWWVWGFNGSIPHGIASGAKLIVNGTLRAKTGQLRAVAFQLMFDDGTTPNVGNCVGSWSDTSTNLTSFSVVGNTAGVMDVGSFLRLTAKGQ